MPRLDGYDTKQTRRPTSEGAEKWLGVPTDVLDLGFVYLVDYMGNDLAIEQAARVSYGGGDTRKVHESRGLIRYLLRHSHTTPFEMIEVKFHAKMPIFVARQWIRHRTANVNEMSARYSVLPDEFYIPSDEVIQVQSVDNKQGRGDIAPDEVRAQTKEFLRMDANQAYQHYTEMIENGVSRELARTNLPVSVYTEWYWKIDLHNLMHFLRLRLDGHAQYEIRVFAEAMAAILSDAFPIAWEAFEDYVLCAEKFSRLELEVLKSFIELATGSSDESMMWFKQALEEANITNPREQDELYDKFHMLGVV